MISAAEGLQPSATGAYDPVNVGGVRSVVQVTVLDSVAELPQPSTAVNVLICVKIQLAVVAVASVKCNISYSTATISSRSRTKCSSDISSRRITTKTTGAYDPLNVGGVRSDVQVTVLDIVAELLQPSTAVNVLTCVTHNR